MGTGFTCYCHNAAAGCFEASFRTADSDGFSGDAGGDRVSFVHAVGIHHPSHNLGARVHVGCGDVGFWTDKVRDFRGVTAGERFELASGEFFGLAGDAAFGAAERDADDGAFPRHPHGKGAHFVEVDARGIADASFGGAADGVVLHTVAGENLDGSVIHFDGEVDDELALGAAKDSSETGVEL